MSLIPTCPICGKSMDDCEHDLEDIVPLYYKLEEQYQRVCGERNIYKNRLKQAVNALSKSSASLHRTLTKLQENWRE